jgi:hypothetical protein
LLAMRRALILGDFSCAPRNRGIGNDVLASGIGVG